MHILLVADEARRGQFVQKGLQYENLSTDLLPLSSPKIEFTNALMRNDGVFLLLKKSLYLEKMVDLCLRFKKIPIVILSQEYQSLLHELCFQKKKVTHFFIQPFPFRQMACEMRNLVFANREYFPNSVLKIRDLELNRETREIIFQKKKIYLRQKEYALLEFFMMNSGKVLSRATILENVWDRNANILTNTVDVHINKLRRKIDDQVSEKFIRTIPCSGYIFG